MRTREFLQALARTPRDWRLEEGKIRRGLEWAPDCPLTAVRQVAQPGAELSRIVRGEQGLSLAPVQVERIIAASDDLPSADPGLRSRLLEACGLT
ncbi:MAG: hypothetical protein ACE5O2_15950 [Armatimonadota bacterium]